MYKVACMGVNNCVHVLLIVMSQKVIKFLIWTIIIIILFFVYVFHSNIILIVMISEPMLSIFHQHDWLSKKIKYEK